MEPTSAYLDSLRPAGSKRSGKRDLIVNVFLRQEGTSPPTICTI